MATVDEILSRIRVQLNLEAETEHEVLEEIRTHLEAALEDARARGMDESEALARVAERFGVDEVAEELQAAHAGRGALEGIAAAALPVLFALLLRWIIFAPGGTAVGWREMLSRPALWMVALVALLFPLARFPRRRYALVAWGVFWGLSILVAVAQAVHW